MARRVPGYLFHKPTGQAYVRVNGKVRYLGKHGSKESRDEYDRIIDEWRATGDVRPGVTVSILALAYWKFAQGYYVKNGKPTDEQAGVKATLRRLRKRCGPMLVCDFRPRHLRELIESMAGEGLTRGYINQCAGRIKRLFAWGCERDMVPGNTYHGLLSVKGLKIGRTQAREGKNVQPVDDATIDATLRYLPPVAADLIRLLRLLRLCGARPSELFPLTPGMIDRTGDVWTYRPERHKTQHFGHDRVLCFGPRAQEILLRHLLRGDDALCFERPTGGPFRRWNLNQTVQRAAKRAKVDVWTPYQLRHSHGTDPLPWAVVFRS